MPTKNHATMQSDEGLSPLGNAAQQVTSPCGKEKEMKKYILKSGRVVTEEQLEDFYRAFTTTTFNERDYKAWKYDKLAASELKFAE